MVVSLSYYTSVLERVFVRLRVSLCKTGTWREVVCIPLLMNSFQMDHEQFVFLSPDANDPSGAMLSDHQTPGTLNRVNRGLVGQPQWREQVCDHEMRPHLLDCGRVSSMSVMVFVAAYHCLQLYDPRTTTKAFLMYRSFIVVVSLIP